MARPAAFRFESKVMFEESRMSVCIVVMLSVPVSLTVVGTLTWTFTVTAPLGALCALAAVEQTTIHVNAQAAERRHFTALEFI